MLHRFTGNVAVIIRNSDSHLWTVPGVMRFKTMHEEKKRSCSAYLAAAVFLTWYLSQAVDCHRLKKTERRHGRKEVSAASQGLIVFGRVFEKGSGFKSQVVDWTRKTSPQAFIGDRSNYQADFAGWSQGQTHDTSSREAAWKRLATSLQCSGTQMLFKAMGPGASQFSVEQEGAPPMPLSQVPSTCGYSMQTDPLALVMIVPYDGCNVLQEGGGYVLPMRWQGMPLSLWCPKRAANAPTTVSQMPGNPDAIVVPEPSTEAMTTKPDTSTFPQHPLFFPVYSYNPFFLPPLPTTTAAPTTSKTTTVSAAAARPPPMYPLPFNPSLYAPFNWAFLGPFPEPAEPTLTQTNLTEHWSLPFPQYIPFYYPSLPYRVFPRYPQYPIQMPEMMKRLQPDPMQYYHFHDRSPAQVHFSHVPN